MTLFVLTGDGLRCLVLLPGHNPVIFEDGVNQCVRAHVTQSLVATCRLPPNGPLAVARGLAREI